MLSPHGTQKMTYLPNESISPEENVKLGKMSIAPCHQMSQFYVWDGDDDVKYLDLKVTMRSSDVILGLPYNIASYALLVHLLATKWDEARQIDYVVRRCTSVQEPRRCS